MKSIFLSVFVMTIVVGNCLSQNFVVGQVFDRQTKEPLVGASVIVPGTAFGTATTINGTFELSVQDKIDSIAVSYIGYEGKIVSISTSGILIELNPSVSNLQQIVVTANREASVRTESPLAITKMSSMPCQSDSQWRYHHTSFTSRMVYLSAPWEFSTIMR